MRRVLATIAATALLVSSVGAAIAIEPAGAAKPAPIVGPTRSHDASGKGHVDHAIDPAADPTDRWIVVLKPGTDATVASGKQGKRIGFAVDRTYRHSLRGYSAHLDRDQVTTLSHDASVAMIVADEAIHAEAQTTPTGISRVSATRSAVARIDGTDQRVDADVAIVDTGITSVADLNVAGGYNCSTPDRAAWRDVYGHGTHVAGTVGAIDNGAGVVGVAPGVRLWAVKILDDTGDGLLSWYVCGLDWIAAQRDPNDPSRPLFEAVNMSVAKWGADDRHCGLTNSDILHQAICRLVASGVTVVAAAGNDSGSAAARVPAAYNEVITVSALADTDGKGGGLGGNRCFSWGTYDNDDSFADFSNYGSDVDLIAPGKCIWSTIPGGYKYSSGTSMAAPHVTGAVALLKASRPSLTPAEVKEALQYLGTNNWKQWTDPDSYHEKLLDVSRIGPHGTFTISAGKAVNIGEGGGAARFPITLARSATLFERVRLSVTGQPAGTVASFGVTSLYGFEGVATTLTVNIPPGMRAGTYPVTVTGVEHGNAHTATATVVVGADVPTAGPPSTAVRSTATLGLTTLPVTVSWPAATDPSSAIGAYVLQRSVDGGAWRATASTGGAVHSVASTQSLGHAYAYRVRSRDSAGNWSGWALGDTVRSLLVQDRWSAVHYTGAWHRASSVNAAGGTLTYAWAAGARARLSFTGHGIAIVAPISPSRGSATVYIDGIYRRTVSFKATTGHSRIVVYSATFPTAGTHMIELRLAGTGRVDLDGFVILR